MTINLNKFNPYQEMKYITKPNNHLKRKKIVPKLFTNQVFGGEGTPTMTIAPMPTAPVESVMIKSTYRFKGDIHRHISVLPTRLRKKNTRATKMAPKIAE